jgi:hypothetical protein
MSSARPLQSGDASVVRGVALTSFSKMARSTRGRNFVSPKVL